MTTVARHRVDMAFIKEQEESFQEYQQTSIGYAHSRPRPTSLYRAFRRSLSSAQYWSFFDEIGSSERMNRSFLLSANAGTALFRAASIQEGSIRVWIDGPLEVPALTPQRFTSTGAWEDSFYVAIASRDYELVDQLAAVPPQIFMPGSDQCFYTWVQTLQAFWRNDPNLPAYLDATHEDIANRKFTPKRTVNLLLQPQVFLCQALLTGDSDIFNRELENTLQNHRKFWGTPANKHEPEGFLSLPAIVFAALAHHIGTTVTTTSGYLLQHLIDRPQPRTISVLQKFQSRNS